MSKQYTFLDELKIEADGLRAALSKRASTYENYENVCERLHLAVVVGMERASARKYPLIKESVDCVVVQDAMVSTLLDPCRWPLMFRDFVSLVQKEATMRGGAIPPGDALQVQATPGFFGDERGNGEAHRLLLEKLTYAFSCSSTVSQFHSDLTASQAAKSLVAHFCRYIRLTEKALAAALHPETGLIHYQTALDERREEREVALSDGKEAAQRLMLDHVKFRFNKEGQQISWKASRLPCEWFPPWTTALSDAQKAANKRQRDAGGNTDREHNFRRQRDGRRNLNRHQDYRRRSRSRSPPRKRRDRSTSSERSRSSSPDKGRKKRQNRSDSHGDRNKDNRPRARTRR